MICFLFAALSSSIWFWLKLSASDKLPTGRLKNSINLQSRRKPIVWKKERFSGSQHQKLKTGFKCFSHFSCLEGGIYQKMNFAVLQQLLFCPGSSFAIYSSPWRSKFLDDLAHNSQIRYTDLYKKLPKPELLLKLLMLCYFEMFSSFSPLIYYKFG